MEALYAGLSAWAIEIGIAALAFYLLYREEQKVYKRRAAKKKKFNKPKTDERELQRFREHLKMINEKTKAIVESIASGGIKDKRTWKKGFKGHGHS